MYIENLIKSLESGKIEKDENMEEHKLRDFQAKTSIHNFISVVDTMNKISDAEAL